MTNSTYTSVATATAPREKFQVNRHHTLTLIDVGYGCELQARSPLSGAFNTIYITLSFGEFVRRYYQWINGASIQQAFHDQDADTREFIMTGISKADWDNYIMNDDDKGDQLEVGSN